ncbi:MAG: PEP-CTERM sorting domain-containing protein [Planctomycetota bacterium]
MKRSAVVTVVMLVCWGVADVQAGWVDFVYRGLEIYATPLGGPLVNAGDGTMVNGARAGRLRIVPSGIGPGYELQLDRNFGVDSRGRPETLHFGGVADLTLSGQTQFTAGYNGRDFRNMRANLSVNELGYNIETNFGAQDAQLTGTLNVFNTLELNSLGFYTANINISNTDSQFVLDGIIVEDTQPTNFDIGPITLEGNIFVDGVAAILSALGADTSGLADLFPNSPIAVFDETLQTDGAGLLPQVAGASEVRDMSPLLLQAVLGQDSSACTALIEGLIDGTLAGNGEAPDEADQAARATLPEPGTLLLMALGGLGLRLRRR